uniref:Uncharacterized protein n=1 Tax=Anguilla anguilla TaxID=7936 RepID=A0A0E9RJA4_ANGAN
MIRKIVYCNKDGDFMMCLGYRPPISKAGRMPQKSLNSSIFSDFHGFGSFWMVACHC